MVKLFISYRRDDTKAIAGRVSDRLAQLLPKRDIFFDVSVIKGGEQFEERIQNSVDKADFVLAFMGSSWLAASSQSTIPRICEENDYVRMEISRALVKNKLVIPVLVDGTAMPDGALLPEDIRGITKRNGLPLRHETFDSDLDAIMLAGAGYKLTDALAKRRHRTLRKSFASLVGVLAGLALSVIGALLHVLLLGMPVSVSIGRGGTTFLIVSCALFGAVAGWVVGSRGARTHSL